MVSGQIGPWSDNMVVPQSTMVNHGWQSKTMDGQTVAGVTLNERFTKIKHQFRTLETPISRKKTNN